LANNDNFNPWDFFREGFKNGNSPTDFAKPDMSWVQDYVNDMMRQSFPQFNDGTFQQGKGKRAKSDVFETHHFMIARVNVPEDILAQNVRVMFHTNELRIEGVESQPLTIRLPGNGLYKGSKAMYKDHVLEIRIPKRKKEQFQEIPIQF
jgi:HSP20 family molecular chaperone IbpA